MKKLAGKFHQILDTRLNKTSRGFVYSILFVIIASLKVSAGVLVAPTVIFLDDKTRTGRMTVQNPTNKPKEITISFSFGIPISDSLGNVSVPLIDSPYADPLSAVEWIKAFPRKLILPANGSQVVRFRAKPPRNLPDGEYWARVVIQSREGETRLPLPTEDKTITTKLNMIMRTAIALKFRKGDLTPQIKLENVKAWENDNYVSILLKMSSLGNCSYVGTLQCRLVDASKREISKSSIQLAVYYDLSRRINLPIVDGTFERPFKVELSITTTGRTDIPAEDILPGNEILRLLAIK